MSDGTRASPARSTPTSSSGELWSLVADGDGWAEWMVDGADIEVDPGARGTVVDDGDARDVRIDSVEPVPPRGLHVVAARPAGPGVDRRARGLPSHTGSRLHVTETYAGASAGVSALAWDVRGMLLISRARVRLAVCRVSERRPLDELFAVLADPTRRAVLEHLVHDGPQTATELAAHFPTDAPGGRQAPAGPRRRRRSSRAERTGREVHYRATTERLADAVAWLVGASASWDRRPTASAPDR